MACVIMYHSVSLPLDAVCSSTGSTWQVNAITNVVFAVCTQMWKRYSLWRIGLFRMLCFRLVLLQEVTAAWCRYVSCLAFPTWFCFTFVHTGFHHKCLRLCVLDEAQFQCIILPRRCMIPCRTEWRTALEARQRSKDSHPFVQQFVCLTVLNGTSHQPWMCSTPQDSTNLCF